MKPTRLTVFAAAAFAAITAALAGCNRPGGPSGDDGSHSTDNVLWRDELFDYAIDTILNRLEEFDSGEMRQQTINRLDQWVRKQKPQEDWQPDPMIAGISGETSAAGRQLVAFAEKIAKLQQDAAAAGPEPAAGLAAEARALGQRLADVAVRFGLIEIARQAEQLLVLADQLGAIEAGGADSAEKAASQARGLVAQIPVAEVGRIGIELVAYGQVIDPALLAFPVTDSFTFQEAVWLRNVAAWASGEQLDDPVKPALALFDWVVKNIQLERTVPTLGQRAAPLVKKPWETLFLGRGTAIERAWVFVLLARQWNLDAALLGLLGEGGQEPAPTRLWAVGVLIEGDVYLFDPSLGLPIVKPGGWRLGELGLTGQPATLSEAAGDDAVLRQMDALQEGDYPVRKEDLQHVVALVEASPGYLTQRMKLVESRLTGDERIVLSSDPSAQAARFKQSPQITDAVLWPLPYQVLWQEIHYGQERFQWQQQNIFGSVFGSALWKARAYHFKGVFTGDPSATQLYQLARQSDFAVSVAHLDAQTEADVRAAKIDASYWLGLVVGQSGNYAAAEDYFRTRVLAVDPDGKWRHGAVYNLARVCEATGRTAEAVELYESDKDAPGLSGNLVRARWLKKLSGAEEETSPARPKGEKETPAPAAASPTDARPEAGKTAAEENQAKPAPEAEPEQPRDK